MEKKYSYRGDLRQTALPEMLAILDQTRIAGVIEAVRGEVRKRVFLKDGYVEHAASSDRVDSLGGYLRQKGLLDDDHFFHVMRMREESGRRLGQLLVEEGLLPPAAVYQAIREHIEGIVWSLFGWEEGQVTFEIGQLPDPKTVRIQIPVRQVILQGVKRSSNARALVQRMGGRDVLFQPHYRVEDLIELALEQSDHKVLLEVDGKRSLFELCTKGDGNPHERARLFYAFSVLQLIRRSNERATPPAGIKIKIPTS